jgi:hypothetical protein
MASLKQRLATFDLYILKREGAVPRVALVGSI